MSATIHSLAPELLEHILDLVRGPGAPTPDNAARPTNSDLLSAALVSRDWAEAAQRVLWLDARITIDQKLPLPFIPSSKYPVKHLWIVIRDHAMLDDVPVSTAIQAARDRATALLEMAPHLHSLCISNFNDQCDPDWCYLRSPSLRELKRLDIEYIYAVEDPITLSTPFHFNLTHLGLTVDSSTPPEHLSRLVRALFATSRDTLTSLRLTSDCPRRWWVLSAYSDALHLVGIHIKNLELNFTTRFPRNGPECFHLGRFSDLNQLRFMAPDGTKHLRKHLDLLPSPATISHLAFKVYDNDGADAQAQEITDVLAHPALAQLERISMSVCGIESLEGIGDAVIEECERRSIRFEFWKEVELGNDWVG
ncbi:hypothetical protein RQP46_003665 [Phenoliferia psychrophenolica]